MGGRASIVALSIAAVVLIGAKPPLPPSAGLPEAACDGVANRTMARMTLAEKVGQMIMVLNVPGFPGFTDTESLIRDHHVGSVVSHAYFGMGPADSAAHNNTLQAAAAATRLGIPVLNAGDFEKGASTIGPTGTTDLPTQMGLGATRSAADTATSARITAEEALGMGFHWTFAPVADVVPTPLNGEIGTRSFGSDVGLVSSLTATQVRTYQSQGMIATAKHFPGLGGSTVNSHFQLPRVSYDRTELEGMHLPAFRAAIAAGVETIMTGHVVVEALDPDLPASLSPAVTTDLLRNELGFDGVIITDSMTLGALLERWSLDEAAVLAVQAGADILMEIGPTEVPLIALAAITDAVASGVISKKRIDTSVRRVLSLKCRYGMLAPGHDPSVSPANAETVAGTPVNLAAASAMSRRAITLVKNEGILPFEPGSSESTLVVGVTSEATVITTPPLSHAPEIAAHVDGLSAGPVATYVAASEDPTAAEILEAVAMADRFDRIVVATYSAGPLPEGQADLVTDLVGTGKAVVAVSIGTPYDVASYPTVNAYVASYALNFLPTYIIAPAAMRATVEVIFGARPGGRLPVPIPNSYPFGHGLRYAE